MHDAFRRALAAVMLASCVASCDVNDCAEIDCVDQALVIVAPKSGQWQPGDYTLQLTHDDETAECAFALPDDISDATTLIDCGPGLVVSFSASVKCTDSCTIDDRFELRVSFDSKVTKLRTVLSRDEDVILDDDRTVEYAEFYPSSPECGPACEQARLKLTIEL
jgi:hypothetical protein